MGFLRDIAQQKCGYKQRIKMEDLMNSYPEGVTVCWVDKITTHDGSEFYSYSFLEDKNACFTAGKAMNDLTDEWLETAGSIDELNKSLKSEPVKFKFVKAKSKNGRTYIRPQFVEESDDDLPWAS